MQVKKIFFFKFWYLQKVNNGFTHFIIAVNAAVPEALCKYEFNMGKVLFSRF